MVGMRAAGRGLRGGRLLGRVDRCFYRIFIDPASSERFQRVRTPSLRTAGRGLRNGGLVVPFDHSFPFPFDDTIDKTSNDATGSQRGR